MLRTPEPPRERRLRRSPRGTPILREPPSPAATPEPEKRRKQYGTLTPVGANTAAVVAAGAGALGVGAGRTLRQVPSSRALESSEAPRQPSKPSSSASPTTPSGASPTSTSKPGQRSVSENAPASASRQSSASSSPYPELPVARRSASNTSLSRRRTPEPLRFRPDSPGINRASGTPTPTPPQLRRVDRRMSGDLRALRQQNNTTPVASASTSASATAPVATTPVANEGRVRSKDMTDVYVSANQYLLFVPLSNISSSSRTAMARAALARPGHRPGPTACADDRACKCWSWRTRSNSSCLRTEC